MKEPSEAALAEVLLYQRRYWTYIGVLTLLMIPLTIVIVLGTMFTWAR